MLNILSWATKLSLSGWWALPRQLAFNQVSIYISGMVSSEAKHSQRNNGRQLVKKKKKKSTGGPLLTLFFETLEK